MKEPLSLVLVGCGAVSQLFYRPALLALAGRGLVRVAAVVDPAEPARRLLQSAFPGAQAAAAMTEVDAPHGSLALIASPPVWHARQTIAALARGWHVLCEKPMAATSAEGERMVAAAEAAGLILAIGHYKRFFPSSRYLKYLCQSTAMLGSLRSFSITEGGPFAWPATSPSFFKKSETPGGVLLDIGVHVLDLLLWWLGDPADFTYTDDAMGGLEANAVLAMRFGAVTGHIQLSRDWATAQRYDFEFTHGRASWIVNEANRLSVTVDGAPFTLQGTLGDADGTVAATNPQSFIAQLQHVVHAIRTATPVLVNGQDGVRVLRLIEACYARKQLLTQPWLGTGEEGNARKWAACS
jgi:predicted dehydrogenase